MINLRMKFLNLKIISFPPLMHVQMSFIEQNQCNLFNLEIEACKKDTSEQGSLGDKA